MAAYTNLVVGCGLSGATVARWIADELGEKVVAIDSRSYVGGNCHDFHDENGICIQRHGAHIFHTNIKEVWDFLGRFATWNPYFHRVKAVVDGIEIPLPFNFNSLRLTFPRTLANRLEKKILRHYSYNQRIPILELLKTGDPDFKFLSDYIYKKIFLPYTQKQWGMIPEDVASSVMARVPVLVGMDDRYFTDRYQGIPVGGYSSLVGSMLDHPLITVFLDTPFERIGNSIAYDRIFYSGSMDEFFHYEFGALPYRSVRFEYSTHDLTRLQSAAVINYPENYDFTRCIEFSHFYCTNFVKKTVVAFEFPEPFTLGTNERAYPVVNDESTATFNMYQDRAKNILNVHFLGRLGDFQYYDMDKAVARALDVCMHISK